MITPERSPKETAYEYAYRVLRENIISLDLEPGSFISENELSAALGMSRAPIREAITELSRTKIIEVYPQRRSIIAYLNYDMVDEAQFIRSCLEQGAVRICCRNITPDGLKKLYENVTLQEFYLSQKNREKLAVLDDAFHELIFELANKSQAHTFISSVSIHFDRVRGMSFEAIPELKIVGDHRAIAEAIAIHDEALALRMLDTHLNRYKLDREAIYAKYSRYFK